MSGQELLEAAHWRYKEHVGVDRILGDPRVVFDECMCIAGELCVPSYRDECVLSRDPYIHCVASLLWKLLWMVVIS